MSVIEHLRELRRRLIIMVLIISAGAVIGYAFYPQILHFLSRPYCSVPADRRFSSGTSKSATSSTPASWTASRPGSRSPSSPAPP